MIIEPEEFRMLRRAVFSAYERAVKDMNAAAPGEAKYVLLFDVIAWQNFWERVKAETETCEPTVM